MCRFHEPFIDSREPFTDKHGEMRMPFRLSQPTAVSAYIFILLTVMNLGLAWSNEKTYYILIHDATQGRLSMQNRNVVIDIDNKVHEKYRRLIINSDKEFKLTFYNEASRRFLCFERKAKKKNWKLVGIRNPRDCSKCMFEERLENGYHRYLYNDTVNNEEHYFSFGMNGNFSNRKIYVNFIKDVTSDDKNDTVKKVRHRHSYEASKCVNREQKVRKANRGKKIRKT